MGRNKKFSREEVLQKALPLFWERGFADTGLQDLEKATGVNKSGLYAEFKNKDDLFLEALRYYGENHFASDILSAEPLGWNNIENLFKMSSTCKNNQKGCFAINSMRETAVLPDEAQKIINENKKKFKLALTKNIAAENTKMDPSSLAEIISTFFSGLAIEQNLKSAKTSNMDKALGFLKMIKSM
jgi:AcrR family transcriptional regulator